jgi:signal transduction histidine kinase
VNDETLIIASMGGIVVVTLLYLRKVGSGAGASHWAAAWLVLWFAGLLLAFERRGPEVAAHAIGSGFSLLILAGALGFAGRPLPRFLARLLVAHVGTQLLLRAAGYDSLALGMATTLDLFAGVAASAVLWRWREPGVGAAERLLGPGVALLVLLNLTDSLVRFAGLDPGFLVAPWIGLGLTLALVQIMAIVDRVMANEERMRRESERLAARVEAAAQRRVGELELLRRIAAAGTAHGDTPALVGAVLEAVRETLALDGGGVWLVSEDGQRLVCAGRFGAAEPGPDEPLDLRTDARLALRVLGLQEPCVFDELSSDARIESPAMRALGPLAGVVLPLCHAERDLGLWVAGRRAPQAFDEADRRLLDAVSDELGLAVEHVRGIELRRLQAEQLANERLTLRAVLESAPVGIFMVDGSWRNTVMNHLGCQHLGIGEPSAWLGRSGLDGLRAYIPNVRDPEALVALMRRLSEEPNRVVDGFEFTLEQPRERTLSIYSAPVLSEAGERVGRVFATRDVTQERALEEQLRQSQKMETLGTLAGGVAHDFNNQLTAILGNARLALDAAPRDPELRATLLELERAADHCAQLTRGLLAFARRAPARQQAVDSARMLAEVGTLLRPTLPQAIALRVDAEPELPAALGDPTQIQQILLNLGVNARDAIVGAGAVAIEARSRTLGPAECAGRASARPGRYVVLSVRDDGAGMEAHTLERIFDPFFTTKPLGSGTGLGLAIVYGLVRANQGWIEVESEPGRGSAFHVWLPAAETSMTPEPAEPPPGTSPRRAGSERILLVEDEPPVRRVARLALEREGYTVIEACDGLEAVEWLRGVAEPPDLTVLDLSMPRMGGLEALAELRRLAPELPVILTSGHFNDASPDPDVECLPKPYRPGVLAERVRAVLDARKRPDGD